MFDSKVRRIQLLVKRDMPAGIYFYVLTLHIFRCVCYCPYTCKVENNLDETPERDLDTNVGENKRAASISYFSFHKSKKQCIFSALFLSLHLVVGVLALFAEVFMAISVKEMLTTTVNVLNAAFLVVSYSFGLMMVISLLSKSSVLGSILERQQEILRFKKILFVREDFENVSQHFMFFASILLLLILNILQFPVSYIMAHYTEKTSVSFKTATLLEFITRNYILIVYMIVFTKASASISVLTFGFQAIRLKFMEMEDEMVCVTRTKGIEKGKDFACIKDTQPMQCTSKESEEFIGIISNSVCKETSKVDRSGSNDCIKCKMHDSRGVSNDNQLLISAFDKNIHLLCTLTAKMFNYQMLMNEYFAVPIAGGSILAVFVTTALTFFGLTQLGEELDAMNIGFWVVPIMVPCVVVYCQADDIHSQVRK